MLSARTVPGSCVAPVTALFLVLSGCTTPDAVREFATTARDATSQFSPFVKDIADSCVRRKLADRPTSEIEDASGPATAACKEDFDLAPALMGSMNVLSSYFNALRQLASNEAVSYDKDLDDFADKLQASTRLPGPATEGVKGLAKFLANALGRKYQKKKIVEDVKAADPHVTALATRLARIVGVEYLRDLDNEQDTVRTRYAKAMQSVGQNEALALLLQRQWRRDLETFQKRKDAALRYQKALECVRDGHKQLAAQVTSWSETELAKDVGPFTASIQGLLSSVQPAF